MQDAKVFQMQIGMADEPCRREDLRKALVLGVRIFRSRREQPVGFPTPRLRAPRATYLTAHGYPAAWTMSSCCRGLPFPVSGAPTWSERRLCTVWTPSRICDAVTALSLPSASNTRSQMASTPASPGDVGLSSTFAI